MTNIGQKAYDYIMEVTGDLINLANSNNDTSEQVNRIASNLTQFANDLLDDSRKKRKEIQILCESILEKAKDLCGIADNISYSYCDDQTAEHIDKIESSIETNITAIKDGV